MHGSTLDASETTYQGKRQHNADQEEQEDHNRAAEEAAEAASTAAFRPHLALVLVPPLPHVT